MENDKIYSAQVECLNCGFCEEITIEQGCPIKKVNCPRCKCMTLQRKVNLNY